MTMNWPRLLMFSGGVLLLLVSWLNARAGDLIAVPIGIMGGSAAIGMAVAWKHWARPGIDEGDSEPRE